MIKKLLALLITVFIFSFSPGSAFAQSTPTFNPLPSAVSPTSPLFTDLLLGNMFHSFSCLTVGSSSIGQPCLAYKFSKDTQGNLQGVPVLSSTNLSGGALGAVSGLLVGLYDNPPVRTSHYLATVGQELGIVKEAQAQVFGSGAGVLAPILTLWQVSRNISYLVMIIIFIVIGVMVMFRNKINPQTVITAQAALPGLVIGLIMITFSYFLAGLIADAAFIGTNIVGAYFSAVKGQANTPQNLVKEMNDQSIIKVVSQFTGVIDTTKATQALNTIWPDLNSQAKWVLTTGAVFITAQTTSQGTEFLKALPGFGEGLQAVLISGASAATALNPTGMIGVAFAFIATFALLYAMFKLLVRLVNNYLSIIFLTISAPFQFLFAALPGRQGIATHWVMQLLSNALAFPAVLAVLYFVAFLLGNDYPPFRVLTADGSLPSTLSPSVHAAEGSEIIKDVTFPLFGGLDLGFVRLILAFGALVALPAIPDVISRAIGAASQAGQIIGQEIGGGIRQGQGYYGQAQSGLGGASGQLGRARGLFDTPHYTIVDYKDGKPVYELSKYHSTAGGISKGLIKLNWIKPHKGSGDHS